MNTFQIDGFDERDMLADLLKGAHERLSSAAWEAQRAAELITHTDKDAMEQINAARRALDRAEQHWKLRAKYTSEYGRATAPPKKRR